MRSECYDQNDMVVDFVSATHNVESMDRRRTQRQPRLTKSFYDKYQKHTLRVLVLSLILILLCTTEVNRTNAFVPSPRVLNQVRQQRNIISSNNNNNARIVRNSLPIPTLDDVEWITSYFMWSTTTESASMTTSTTATALAVTTIIRNILSATITYFTLIAYYDRPRGEIHSELHQLVHVQPSPILPFEGGLGVFCTVPSIPRNTVLGTYPGVVVPLHPAQIQHPQSKIQRHPYCEAYIWRFSDNQYIIDPTNRYGILHNNHICYGGNPNMFASIWFHQTVIPFLLGDWVSVRDTNHNHHSNNRSSSPLPIIKQQQQQKQQLPFVKSTVLCRINEPPKGYDVNVYTVEDCQRRTVTFITERTIYQHEELFIDYGLQYDRSNYR
jgi:hypothetical protein